jgi:hypothetical protein
MEFRMSQAVGPYSVQEHVVHGETQWVAIRARGAEWSWLTADEAVTIARAWIEKYAPQEQQPYLVAAE